jgi:threonine/homoserine/homoserine lactone efflux protein
MAGCFVHVSAAAIGVSALLAASATAFTVLKWAGAAYLLWVGVQLLLRQGSPSGSPLTYEKSPTQMNTPSYVEILRGGFLTNVLNPKVAIFFLAFVPQFIAPGAPHKALDFLALGTLFNINSLAVNAGWALAAAWLAGRGAVQRALRWLDRVAGAMFIGFGLRLALAEAPTR